MPSKLVNNVDGKLSVRKKTGRKLHSKLKTDFIENNEMTLKVFGITEPQLNRILSRNKSSRLVLWKVEFRKSGRVEYIANYNTAKLMWKAQQGVSSMYILNRFYVPLMLVVSVAIQATDMLFLLHWFLLFAITLIELVCNSLTECVCVCYVQQSAVWNLHQVFRLVSETCIQWMDQRVQFQTML